MKVDLGNFEIKTEFLAFKNLEKHMFRPNWISTSMGNLILKASNYVQFQMRKCHTCVEIHGINDELWTELFT